jgi:hypothetical protein
VPADNFDPNPEIEDWNFERLRTMGKANTVLFGGQNRVKIAPDAALGELE